MEKRPEPKRGWRKEPKEVRVGRGSRKREDGDEI